MPRNPLSILAFVLAVGSAGAWAQSPPSPSPPPDPDEAQPRPPISAEDSANVDAKASAPSGAIIDESRTPEERRASPAAKPAPRASGRERRRLGDRPAPPPDEPATGGQGAVTSQWRD